VPSPATLIAAAALCLLLAGGCLVGGDVDCPDGMEPFTELNIYFGQEKGDGGTVSEEEWQVFLADAVTLKFPDGLTVLDARGQWFDTEEGRLYQESTKLLNVLVPVDATESSVGTVRGLSDIYKDRFDQQAVFHTSLPACAAVY
jgi:hypothetical protein